MAHIINITVHLKTLLAALLLRLSSVVVLISTSRLAAYPFHISLFFSCSCIVNIEMYKSCVLQWNVLLLCLTLVQFVCAKISNSVLSKVENMQVHLLSQLVCILWAHTA